MEGVLMLTDKELLENAYITWKSDERIKRYERIKFTLSSTKDFQEGFITGHMMAQLEMEKQKNENDN